MTMGLGCMPSGTTDDGRAGSLACKAGGASRSATAKGSPMQRVMPDPALDSPAIATPGVSVDGVEEGRSQMSIVMLS